MLEINFSKCVALSIVSSFSKAFTKGAIFIASGLVPKIVITFIFPIIQSMMILVIFSLPSLEAEQYQGREQMLLLRETTLPQESAFPLKKQHSVARRKSILQELKAVLTVTEVAPSTRVILKSVPNVTVSVA